MQKSFKKIQIFFQLNAVCVEIYLFRLIVLQYVYGIILATFQT